MNPALNPTGMKTPLGKVFPEYSNPNNIPISYVSLSDPLMKKAYANAKNMHARKGLGADVKKMTITSVVIAKDGKILGEGCNGDGWHQDNNRCVRIENKRPTGQFYEECPGCTPENHGERTAIRKAKEAGEDVRGADLYLYGHWWLCTPCWNAITEAGIGHIYLLENGDTMFDRTAEGSVIGTPKQYAGKIITVEGSDGTGKGTQVALLTENLKAMGYSIGNLSFPRYKSNTIGGQMLQYLIKSDRAEEFQFSKVDPYIASLPYAMDRAESKPLIEEMLQEFDFVIMDRYYTANLLHQGAKFADETARNRFLDTMYNIEIKELGIVPADIIIYLTLPVEISIQRVLQRMHETGEPVNQTEKDHEYIRNSIERGLEIAKHLGWQIIEGIEMNAQGVVTKEYSKEERQQTLLEILRTHKIINA